MDIHPLHELADVKETQAVCLAVSQFCEIEDLPGHDTGRVILSSDPDERAAASDPDMPLPVAVVYLKKDKRWYKLDGHRRAKLWERGELPSPGYLMATVVRVGSAEAARKARKSV